MPTSPLADIHVSLGARFTELSGRPVVANYGDAAAEHRAVRASGGLIDRSYRGKLTVSGPDRAALLQGMTTNDVEKQGLDRAIFNAICTGHGKVQSLFTCARFDDHYLLDMDPVVTEFTAAFLEKYTIIRDAKTQDVSAERAHFGLYGPGAVPTAAAGLNCGAEDLPSEMGQITHHGEALVLATDEYGVAGFEIILPLAAGLTTWQALSAAGAAHGVSPFGFDALESLRIEAGRARYGVEVDDSTILLEAGFADTANFEKGCYIGQETLSRIVFRGQVNKALRGVLLGESLPEIGTELLAGDKVVGTIRSAVMSPSLGRAVALAYVKRSHWDNGAEVTVAGEAAEVTELPIFPPKTA